MSETRKSRYEDETERDDADDGDVCESDRRFLESISENIKRDKDHLQCPDQGPDVHRYIIYSNAFDEVIQRATVYKGLLSAIKKEYDDAISTVKKSQYEARVAQRKRNAMEAQAPSLVNYHRRAAQLKDRITIIQRDTAEVQSKLDKLQQSSGDKSAERKSVDEAETRLPKQIPGLSLEQSLDLEALEGHLQCLESRRDMLQDRKKSLYVHLEVKQQLDSKLKTSQAQTHPLTSENDGLCLQYRRLKVVSDSLSRWKDSGRPVPLAELLSATLENISHISDSDCDSTDCVLLEDENPAKVKESKLLVDYVDRFTELFESGDYEAAAFHAARSPHGVLRNQHTVDKFKLVKEYDGRMPPFLHFFQALMVSCTQRERPLLGEVMVSGTQAERPLLGESLSVDGVRCALQHNVMELVIHGITLHKLAFSEVLGDVLTEHAQMHPGTADMCLTLAHAVYAACRLHRKAALSMCRRGMLHAALDYMYQCPNFTAEDSMWCLSRCPSLPLLQMLTTESLQGQQAMLSVGLTCYRLLMAKQHHLLAVQLLDSLCSKGTGVLEQAMVSDSRGWVELWGEISTCCVELQRSDLSRHILSVLLAHTGTSRLSPDLDGLSLMDHVFL